MKLKRSGLGLEFKKHVDEFLVRIADNPEQFRKMRREIRRAILRRFPYTIHFLPEPDRIIVVAVFHGKRDPRHLEARS